MRLVKLSCDQASFRPIKFNPSGLTLVLGDASETVRDEGSSNGVGKTLSLGLIHHCLAGTPSKRLQSAVPNWMFALDFELGDAPHRIERSGDGKTIALDEKHVTLKFLREWLNECGAFRLDPAVPNVTFRSLFSRFGRLQRADCLDPIHTAKEPPFDALLRSLYLLGLDVSLVNNKRLNKLELESLGKSAKNWKSDQVLRDLFRAGSKPKVRAEFLEREIPRLKADLAQFQVAEDYRQIELQAGEFTRELRRIEVEQAAIHFQLDGISKALETHPDIGREELLHLYEGLQNIFRPEALAHFDAVDQFHRSLAANRKARLEQDRIALTSSLRSLEEKRKKTADERDLRLQTLTGKRALDEYASLARQVAVLEEEKRRIDAFMEFEGTIQERSQEIRRLQVEEDGVAARYIQSKPLTILDRRFSEIAGRLYPNQPAGLDLENNVGRNQVRYNLAVQIEGDASDGINAARILCFDWLLLTQGANHTMDFLWHDNRLFADMDPRPRAAWFRMLLQELVPIGKQYIATINTENFDAMREHLSEEEWSQLNESVAIILRGDAPEHKLLGIQFGG